MCRIVFACWDYYPVAGPAWSVANSLQTIQIFSSFCNFTPSYLFAYLNMYPPELKTILREIAANFYSRQITTLILCRPFLFTLPEAKFFLLSMSPCRNVSLIPHSYYTSWWLGWATTHHTQGAKCALIPSRKFVIT